MVDRTFVSLVMVCYMLLCAANKGNENRRLVLHSDTDVVEELNKLRTELNDQRNEIRNMAANMAGQDAEIKTLASKFQSSSSNTGSSYIRWGRNSCPGNGTALAYSGFMAGSSRVQVGGSTNYLCLAGQPLWDYYDEGDSGIANIYGVEYEFSHSAAIRANFFGADIQNDEAPCAVCYTNRGTNIMIPGRNKCYDGWTMEYSGYVVTEDMHSPLGVEYVCLDRRPDVIVGSQHDDNENVLYFVEAKCGKSLECPPYVDGRELACVVCSK